MTATLVSPKYTAAFDLAWSNLTDALTLDDAISFIKRWASSQRRARRIGLLLIDRMRVEDAWVLLDRLGEDAGSLLHRFGELQLD